MPTITSIPARVHCVLLLASSALGMAPLHGHAAEGETPADISGFWVRTDEEGAGSFDAALAKIAAAQLTPEAQAQNRVDAAERAQHDEQQKRSNDGIYRVLAKCDGPGIVFMMQHSGAIDIVQARDATLIIPEHPGTQTVYTDGRAHPVDWSPAGAGHSIGQWENGDFLVSTVGMTAGGNIPGGGRKTPATELIERFHLRDAQHMVVTFTWSDPKIYLQPHVYQLTYERQPEGSYAFESWCDLSDPLQGQSIVVPK